MQTHLPGPIIWVRAFLCLDDSRLPTKTVPQPESFIQHSFGTIPCLSRINAALQIACVPFQYAEILSQLLSNDVPIQNITPAGSLSRRLTVQMPLDLIVGWRVCVSLYPLSWTHAKRDAPRHLARHAIALMSP